MFTITCRSDSFKMNDTQHIVKLIFNLINTLIPHYIIDITHKPIVII